MAYINGKEILFSANIEGSADAEAARQEGYADGYAEGYEKGKSEGGNFYNEFWDTQLDNGKRTNFNSSFFGSGWTDVTFNPNRPLLIKSAVSTFASNQITDYTAIAERIGGIDFTGCTSFNMTWQSSRITKIGTVDFSSATGQGALNNTFNYCQSLKTIEKCMVVKENVYQNTFGNCTSLEEIRFNGEIGNNISFAQSKKLSFNSAENIADHLVDFSTDASEYPNFAHAITISHAAWERYFEEDQNRANNLISECEIKHWNLITQA